MLCPLCSSPRLKARHQVKEFTYTTCLFCGVSFITPFPDAATIKNWYADEAYFALGEGNTGYADYMSLESGLQKTFLRRNALLGDKDFWKDKKIMEIGCAYGFYADALKNIPGIQYTGVDLNKHAIDILKKKGFQGIAGDIESIAQRNYFDIIAFFDVLEHIHEPFTFLTSVRARLKPQGHLFFTTPSTKSFLAQISGKKWVSYIVPHHILLYEPKGIKNLLTASGFSDIHIRGDFQWVSLSFLNERVSNLTGVLKNLTSYFKNMEDKGRGFLIPVTNGQMLVHARKN